MVCLPNGVSRLSSLGLHRTPRARTGRSGPRARGSGGARYVRETVRVGAPRHAGCRLRATGAATECGCRRGAGTLRARGGRRCTALAQRTGERRPDAVPSQQSPRNGRWMAAGTVERQVRFYLAVEAHHRDAVAGAFATCPPETYENASGAAHGGLVRRHDYGWPRGDDHAADVLERNAHVLQLRVSADDEHRARTRTA